MLSHIPNIAVKNPKVVIKQRKNDTAVDWFTEEIEYDRSETEEKIEQVLSLFEIPKKLPELRPDEDWKCNNDDHWEQFVNGIALSDL
jgi:hypothetical protein